MSRTALIFGISGQDGSLLARFLLRKGYKVHGVTRDGSPTEPNNLKILGINNRVTLRAAQLDSFEELSAVIAQVSPDEIYNLSGQSSVGASFTKPLQTLESIVSTTVNILETIKYVDSSIRFYNAGSSDCFGDVYDEPADEETDLSPQSPYAVAKCAAYAEVLNARVRNQLFAVTGFTFNHESPLRGEQFVTRKVVRAAALIESGCEHRLTLGDLSIERDWGWAPEYVGAMWGTLQLAHPADFIIATGRRVSLRQFVEYAFTHCGLDWRDHVIQDCAYFRPSEIRSSYGNPAKANELLHWEAQVHVKSVAERMIEAERLRIKSETFEAFIE